MIYKFNVKMTDYDYLEFNKFWAMKSHYGKRQMLSYRIIILVIMFAFGLISLYGGGFSVDSFITIIPFVLLMILFQLCLSPIFGFALKNNIKNLKKAGKMPYSANSILEFYDDEFVEITVENECRQKYAAIERISIINGKFIYIHINNIMAYILPWFCFDSNEQRNEFIEFIKTKCDNIDFY